MILQIGNVLINKHEFSYVHSVSHLIICIQQKFVTTIYTMNNGESGKLIIKKDVFAKNSWRIL